MKPKLRIVVGVLGILAWLSGISILVYFWVELGRRGIVADETGTSGYITDAEIAVGALGVTLFVVGGGAFVVSTLLWRLKRSIPRQPSSVV